MRRFLLIALILALVIGLAGSLTANLFLYTSHLTDQSHLNLRATRIAGLEAELGQAQTGLRQTERQLEALEQARGALEADYAALEAELEILREKLDSQPEPSTPTPAPAGPRPTVFMTAPASGEQFAEGAAVTVRWNALDRDGVSAVTLSVDGAPVAQHRLATASPLAEGEFTWTAEGVGSHRLSVTASNLAGLESLPAGVSIEIVAADGTGGALSGPDAENAAIMDAIEPLVIGLRGLEPLWQVTRTLYSPPELAQFLMEELDRDYPPEDARRDAIEMAAFDLVPADTDLRTLMEALYTEQIAGFYDTDTRSLVVVSDEAVMDPLEKATYAHEFTHALQDQHYDLDALDPEENDDASLAVTALIEGDATLVMQQYMLEFLDTDELFELLSESMAAESTVLDSAPEIIRAQLSFPYDAGFEFVSALYEQGGYQAVDRAFQDPPQSTEQILHPERYLAGELPQVVSLPPLTETLGSGWRLVDENVLGEFALQLYLTQHLSQRRVDPAADGWGGDRYAVYTHDETGAIVMVMRTAWDTAAEANEFAQDYVTFGKGRFGFAPTTRGKANCWSGEDAICLYRAGSETLVIRAPDLDQIAALEPLFPEF